MWSCCNCFLLGKTFNSVFNFLDEILLVKLMYRKGFQRWMTIPCPCWGWSNVAAWIAPCSLDPESFGRNWRRISPLRLLLRKAFHGSRLRQSGFLDGWLTDLRPTDGCSTGCFRVDWWMGCSEDSLSGFLHQTGMKHNVIKLISQNLNNIKVKYRKRRFRRWCA